MKNLSQRKSSLTNNYIKFTKYDPGDLYHSLSNLYLSIINNNCSWFFFWSNTKIQQPKRYSMSGVQKDRFEMLIRVVKSLYCIRKHCEILKEAKDI